MAGSGLLAGPVEFLQAGYTLYRVAPQNSEKHARSVLLLNGCALPAGMWEKVAALLPGREILAIDRPGFAGRAWRGDLPTLGSEVAVLAQALASASAAEPAIVVAHSMASFRAEALAQLEPELVAGIVMVDPSIEAAHSRDDAGRKASRSSSTQAPTAWWQGLGHLLLRPGLVRRLIAGKLFRLFRFDVRNSAAVERRVFHDPYTNADTLLSAAAEWLCYGSQARQLAELRRRREAGANAVKRLPVPTVTVYAGGYPGTRRSADLAAHLRVAGRIDVRDSGHLVMVDRPDAIARAVERLETMIGGSGDEWGTGSAAQGTSG